MNIEVITLPPCETVEQLRQATQVALRRLFVHMNAQKQNAPLDLNNQRMINVGYPNSLTDGVNVRYLKKAIVEINVKKKTGPGGSSDNWWGRAIVPGTATASTDVMDNRYRLKIAEDEMVVLERCSPTAKAAPSSADYLADILVSTDTGTSFTTLFGTATNSKVTIPQGTTVGEQATFSITKLYNNNELRVDVLQGGGAIGIELVLKGKIVPKDT